MKNACIYPGAVSGVVKAPPSKSVSQRVLAAVFARGGSLRISNRGNSADERVILELLRDAGFITTMMDDGDMMITDEETRSAISHADFGSSALAARMMTPVLALQENLVRLDGSRQLRARPMEFLTTWLPQLGVRVSKTGGHLPASMQGPLQPKNVTVDASVTSQALSGLILAYSIAGAAGKVIEVPRLVSRSYVDLTLQVMQQMGLPIPTNEDYHRFVFPQDMELRRAPAQFHIDGDWSGAAFLLVAGAIAGEVSISDLDPFSLQPDRQVLNALMAADVSLSVEGKSVRTSSSGRLRPFQFDATECPDLFPPLAILACMAPGTSAIKGVERLSYKESDRAATITEELRRMGADLQIQDEYLIIRGGKKLQGTELHSHGDHRIAMMCAVAGLVADGPVLIQEAHSVDKSYPQFFSDLIRIGVRVADAG